MNIVELIPHLKNREKAEKMAARFLPGIDFETIDVYMRDNVSIQSEIVFFDAEAISNDLIMEVDGITYENLYPLYIAQDMTEDYVRLYHDFLSDEKNAQKLLDYWKNDA